MTTFIEPVPVDDIFVTEISKIEGLGDGMIRSYLTTREAGGHILRVKLVIPLTCALGMNERARPILNDEYYRTYGLRAVM